MTILRGVGRTVLAGVITLAAPLIVLAFAVAFKIGRIRWPNHFSR